MLIPCPYAIGSKLTNISAEGEVCISRLSAKYSVSVFRAMHDLISEMEVIGDLQEVADGITDPNSESKKKLLAKIEEKKAKVAEECGNVSVNARSISSRADRGIYRNSRQLHGRTHGILCILRM